MDAELKDYLNNIARSSDSRFDDVNAQLHDVRGEIRDVREEMRSMRTEMREMSQRITNVGMDYREARQVRDVRAIALEGRVNELERRMSELEGGRQ
jgi:chromosome segregation ATPase